MSDEAQLVQTGGVLAFAGVVLSMVRNLGPVLKALATELQEIRYFIAAILERDRIRDERRKRESTPPVTRRPQEYPISSVPSGEFERQDETTNVIKLIEIEREKARQKRGARKPQPGKHHDGED